MQRIPNYGSFMQALSLKYMIESLGHEVVFVDYNVQPDINHRNNAKAIINFKRKKIAKFIKGTYIGNSIYYSIKKKSRYSEIVEKQKVFSSCNYLLGITNKYHYRTKVDILVIGSDEVFNCTQSGYNVGYSLELFGKNNHAKKTITYAASFGNTTYSKLLKYGIANELSMLLSKIAKISVRDNNSQTIIKLLCGFDAERHLDPVLVGGIENYFGVLPHYSNYILLYGYMYRFSKEECEAIMDFAHINDKIVISIGEPQLKSDYYVCCRPDEVLGYFRKADLVITDTFHGTIFSVVTHKKFLTAIRESIIDNGGNKEKLESLLDDLHLLDRKIDNFNSLNKIFDDINYTEIDKIREEGKIKAMAYLNSNLRL